MAATLRQPPDPPHGQLPHRRPGRGGLPLPAGPNAGTDQGAPGGGGDPRGGRSHGLLLWIGIRVAPLYLGKGPGGGPASLRRAAADDRPGGEEHWKLGLAYYNPDDPAIFVEKHLGIGYTLNFARPEVWLLLALLLAAPVLLLAWMLS